MTDQNSPQITSSTGDDVLALRAADRYFDFLAAGQTPPSEDDIAPELTGLFSEWRTEVGAVPIPATPTLDPLLGLPEEISSPQPADTNPEDNGKGRAKVIDINSRRWATSWKREAIRAVSGAAAFLIIAAGGLTVAIQSAGLNDPLWSVNRALFTSNANDIELATYLDHDIDRARALAESGQGAEAQQALERVQTQLDSINADSRREDVRKRLDDTRKVVDSQEQSTAKNTTSSTSAPSSVINKDDKDDKDVTGKDTTSPVTSEANNKVDTESAKDNSLIPDTMGFFPR